MTKNFSKYQKIIDNFRGQVSNRNFETMFASKCENIPKTERFLLKMELKRLAGVCTRLVDLRGHVDGECRAYEHDGRSHFLDDLAIKVFEENVGLYGKYTFGVYEAVTNTENNFRVIYQREKAGLQERKTAEKTVTKAFDKTQYSANIFKFGSYHNRYEERMNFSIALAITAEGKKIECNSSDISVYGCKFRASTSDKFTVGQDVTIRFIGLEKEFQFGAEDTFEYKIKNIQLTEGVQLVGVKRIHSGENKRDGFTQFLKGFIQGNKRRYKINLDNTISALQARNFEQYVLPKSSELPVFIEGESDGVMPKYVLSCPNNQHVYQYWQDENHHSTLNFLVTPERVKRLQKAYSLGKSLLVYSFIHKSQGKFFFYTADEFQLKEDADFMREFLGFASNKEDFAVTSLSISEVDIDKANSFFTLSDSITKKDQYLNLPIADDVMKSIDSLAYIVVASDITDERLSAVYKALPYDNVVPARLRAFGHKRLPSPILVEKLGINYKNHRQESRFKYVTPVQVTCKKETWSAESQDFSASGLKVEFADEVSIKKGDVVQLTFPSLQKITSSFDLKKLPYEVVRVNKKKTIINLRVYVEQHKHIGRAFFKALIDKNKDKLTPDEYASMVPGIAKPLRNIYSSSIKTPSLIVQTSGSRYKIETVALGQEHGKLLPIMRQLSDRPGFYNLYPLLSNLSATNLLATNLKKMHASDSAMTDIMYISINPDADMVDNAVITKLESELNTVKLQQMFIKTAKRRGVFFCIQVKICRTDSPDMDYLTPELSYISSYAIHRGKQIEQDIWNVAGVIQVIDITQEALLRANMAVYIPQEIAVSE
jgi:hypothetical protein